MPATEVATLRLTPPYSWESPEVQEFFKSFAEEQTKWMGSASLYFQDIADPAFIYVIKEWGSYAIHQEWIKSAANQNLLKKADGLLGVEGLINADMACKVTADDPVVVWTQRKRAARDNTLAAKGSGKAIEDQGLLCSLEGYKHDVDVGEVVSNHENKVCCLRKLSS